MNKTINILISILVFTVFCSSAWSVTLSQESILNRMFDSSNNVLKSKSMSRTVYSYEILNSSGVQKITYIPTGSIIPSSDKIVGYSIMPYSLDMGSEGYIGIFDTTTIATSGECLAESEVENTMGKSELWPYGKSITNGVAIVQGANTSIQIYFVRE